MTLAGTYALMRPPAVFPDTSDKLMADFQAIYEEIHVGEFVKMRHPLHVAIPQESTRDTFANVGTSLDFEEELHLADRMFSGQDVTDPNGALEPGVEAVTCCAGATAHRCASRARLHR